MPAKIFAGAALLALCVAGPLNARQAIPSISTPADGRILGIVVDDDNKPVAGALVMLGDGRSTETGADGRFSFVRVRPGANEIAAVTKACAIASGGLEVQSGVDALLRLVVVQQTSAPGGRDRSRGTATRRLDESQLQRMIDRSALEAIEELAPHAFAASGSKLTVTSRAISLHGNEIEPLLVVDGVRMSGFVADALRSMRATDLSGIDIHLGSAAGWEFQNGGASAVIEIETRNGPPADPFQNPAMCLNRNGR